MNGSRLFILSPYANVAKAWVDMLTSRMRARKLFDRFPGTKVVAHPWAMPAQPTSHADRLYMRDMLTRGSTMQRVDDEPCHTAALDEVIDEWTERQRRAAFLRDNVGGWGDPYGKILFVGEDSLRHGDRPFSGIGKVAHTMTALLDAAKLREPEIYLLSAWDSKDMTKRQLAMLAPYEIVALGVPAHERLTELGMKSFVQFPHPYHLADLPASRVEKWGKKLAELVEHVIA